MYPTLSEEDPIFAGHARILLIVSSLTQNAHPNNSRMIEGSSLEGSLMTCAGETVSGLISIQVPDYVGKGCWNPVCMTPRQSYIQHRGQVCAKRELFLNALRLAKAQVCCQWCGWRERWRMQAKVGCWHQGTRQRKDPQTPFHAKKGMCCPREHQWLVGIKKRGRENKQEGTGTTSVCSYKKFSLLNYHPT